jgi:uncharacterized membrane protein
MKSKASIAGHPLHPIFVCIPIGLWTFTPVCDLIYHLGWGGDAWKSAALYCLAGGLVGAVPALITGWIDYSLCQTDASAKVAKFHMILNFSSLPIFALSIWLRFWETPPNYSLVPVALSLFGVVFISVSGWLGGELVVSHHISVHEKTEK